MNTQMLKGKIVESGITQEAVADAIGMNRCTFYRKMKRKGNTFTVEEMNKIVQVIPLSREEAVLIFFTS
ncbi:helix-turn-helix domain-containing protein [Lacrimispora algidixylanolytica]|uniref:Phage repressor protein n=1 Tax=Lacrimispora algidixylanolytica TaxID=94868 RepID=A0A419T917_9FIRM|nr:XRE family transcriptional regulator [Lacrimispora algidixylanolytica]RKD33963.1 phage repressor protein [Lacrimispora algidixylanolytica]